MVKKSISLRSELASILRASLSGSYTNADLCIFRLESADGSSRTPALKIARSPIPEATELNTFSVDPTVPQATRSAGFAIKTCETRQGSVILADYHYDYSDVVTGFGDRCRLIPGNSGSPAFDSNGMVPAIAFATGRDDLRIEVNKEAKKNGVGGTDAELHVGLFTSFVCLPFPSGVPSPAVPSECAGATRAQLDRAGSDAQRAMVAAPVKADEQSLSTDLRKDGPQPFKYSVREESAQENTQNDKRLSYNIHLDCLRPQGEWQPGSYSMDGGVMRVSFSVPAYKYGLFLDDFARVTTRRIAADETRFNVQVDISRVTEKDGAVGSVSSTEQNGSTPLRTHWCSATELAQN